MSKTNDDKMNELYEAFLNNLLSLVKSGNVKASDRAVIRQFLKDHNMADKFPNHPGVQSLAAQYPTFPDEDSPQDDR